MALPQQVLERMSEEQKPQTPGWSLGLLSFTGGVFLIAVIVYFGMMFGYEPYLNGRITDLNTQISAAAQSVSSTAQNQLITTYSQAANLQQVLANHVQFSSFFAWLEKNTEANVSFSRLSFSSGNQITLSASAATEADANQQLAIFEASPDVKSVNMSGVSQGDTGKWQFNILLIMNNFSLLGQ